MTKSKTPKSIKNPLPPITLNLEGFHRNLRREGTPDRVYFFEHGVADNIQQELHERFGIWDHIDPGSPSAGWDKAIATHRFLGHEYFRVFPEGARLVAPRHHGEWTNQGKGVITCMEEFEAYPWPDPENADLSVLDYYEQVLPPDMRVFHVVDLWEVVRDMMGFETMCFAIYENPELVHNLFDRVGGFIFSVLDKCLKYQCYGATYLADDLGYKTSLMISPDHVRQFILPWHKKLAELTHRHGKLFFFHSCGQIYSIIDDFIDIVKIDAKHSFEENVLPVEEVKKLYGKRMTLLGGIDVDLLARSDPDTIRKKTRLVLDICQPGGGYFLGAGNWVTSYIPLDNYLAMLKEGREFRMS